MRTYRQERCIFVGDEVLKGCINKTIKLIVEPCVNVDSWEAIN
jgi:hypothetical protein